MMLNGLKTRIGNVAQNMFKLKPVICKDLLDVH